jgi:hypothetical protein
MPRVAGKRKPKQLALAIELVDPAFREAMRDAREIREWTHGPNVPGWMVYRLAQALMGKGNERAAKPRFGPARSGVHGDQGNLPFD